jgi:hypothetical protein
MNETKMNNLIKEKMKTEVDLMRDAEMVITRTKGGSDDSALPSLISVIARDFAEKLAKDILTVGYFEGDIECDRAQMMKQRSDGTEQNMGGRSKDSLVRLIECHVLDKFDPKMSAITGLQRDGGRARRKVRT